MSYAVEDFTRWAHSVANVLLPAFHPDHDDVVQEGLIEIARCLAVKDDPSAVYLTKAARHSMQSAAYDGKLTGLDRRQRSGPPPAFADSLSQLAEDAPGYLEGQHSLAVVDAGYAEAEWHQLDATIQAALFDALDDRDAGYVRARFWEGKRDVDIAAETGRTAKALGNRWASVIRPALRVALADLAELA